VRDRQGLLVLVFPDVAVATKALGGRGFVPLLRNVTFGKQEFFLFLINHIIIRSLIFVLNRIKSFNPSVKLFGSLCPARTKRCEIVVRDERWGEVAGLLDIGFGRDLVPDPSAASGSQLFVCGRFLAAFGV